jgi:hypothetical protein
MAGRSVRFATTELEASKFVLTTIVAGPVRVAMEPPRSSVKTLLCAPGRIDLTNGAPYAPRLPVSKCERIYSDPDLSAFHKLALVDPGGHPVSALVGVVSGVVRLWRRIDLDLPDWTEIAYLLSTDMSPPPGYLLDPKLHVEGENWRRDTAAAHGGQIPPPDTASIVAALCGVLDLMTRLGWDKEPGRRPAYDEYWRAWSTLERAQDPVHMIAPILSILHGWKPHYYFDPGEQEAEIEEFLATVVQPAASAMAAELRLRGFPLRRN